MPSEIPRPPFLYTLDQLAQVLNVTEAVLRARYIYFDDRSPGPPKSGQLTARNISRPEDTPEWRVTDSELARWLKSKGFRRNFERWY